jgi:hypothetical protein
MAAPTSLAARSRNPCQRRADGGNAAVSGHRGVRGESRTVATRETLAGGLVRHNSSPWLRMNARPMRPTEAPP